ncbi:endonuclease/Exonuclease/phosphatase family protein [Sarocladium implicatum]|nr:endonuclease/Exonuclease/phosphatase family protein [Sarocladium implicatum]
MIFAQESSFINTTEKEDKVMPRRSLLVIPILVASLAYLLVFINSNREEPRQYIRGKNATVLFVTNAEHGLSNVHIATAQSLLEYHQDIDVHYASFPGTLDGKLKRMASYVRRRSPNTKDVTFHELSGKSFSAAGNWARDDRFQTIIHPPGVSGLPGFMVILEWLRAWNVEDHMEVYRSVSEAISKVDPAVVVLDTIFAPAVDAVRESGRFHMYISPNTLAENFAPLQPYGKGFWKYPAIATGFSYPLAWRNIPANIYMNYRIIKQVLRGPRVSELRKAGIKNPSSPLNTHRKDVPWITMNTEGAALPVEYVPANVTGVGPIVLSSAPAIEQDAELVAWASRRQTILINLGSGFEYMHQWAIPMVKAVADLLDQTEGKVQVLWKFNTNGDVPDGLTANLQPHIESGRLRLSRWLTVDPVALLESGAVAVSVHHGGSNCYHEAVSAGVPHIILPLWADLYGFAALVEDIGIGIWPCKQTAPYWTSEGLLDAMLTTIDEKTGGAMKRRAHELGQVVRAQGPGRDLAAKQVAKYAMESLLEQAMKDTVALRKTVVAWRQDAPHPQPWYVFDSSAQAWIKIQTSDSLLPSTPGKGDYERVVLFSWNIDFMLPFAEIRMKLALAHLEDLVRSTPSTAALVILIQECTPEDLQQIAQTPWIRERFQITDLDATNWATNHYGTVTLVDSRVPITSAFRVHYSKTRMDRDALFVDILLHGKSVRLCNTHLESLALSPPFRPFQMEIVSKHLHEPGVHAGLVAGDFNAIQPFDRTLHSDTNLKDAFLELGGEEDTEEGYTWGQQAATKFREQFGCSRMDKLFFCGGMKVVKFARFGEDVVVESEEEAEQIKALGFEKAWVTDHLGIKAEISLTGATSSL